MLEIASSMYFAYEIVSNKLDVSGCKSFSEGVWDSLLKLDLGKFIER